MASRRPSQPPHRHSGEFVREVVSAVRKVWPERWPLLVRISATDWVEGGWDPDQSVELARRVRELKVDLIDVSSGGLSPDQHIELAEMPDQENAEGEPPGMGPPGH